MNDTSIRRSVIVGLFVLLGTIFFLAGVLLVGNLKETFKRKFELYAVFDDIGGVQKGNNVWFSGVKVGVISDVEFQPDASILVTLLIDNKVQKLIANDSKVKISSDGFIGNKILVIYGGSTDALPVKTGNTLMVEKVISMEDMMNTLQKNNDNLLAITSDIRTISSKIVNGEGTIGRLMNEDGLYQNIDATIVSFQKTAAKAETIMGSLAEYSAGLKKEGTLANEIISDTLVFQSVKASVLQLQQMADSASVLVTNLKQASTNPNSPVGMMLTDEETATRLKETMKNLESSSKKLDEDLEALQSNFLLRRYFKKKAKQQ